MQQCHKQLCPVRLTNTCRESTQKMNGDPKKEQGRIPHLLKIMGKLLQDSASSPEASSYCSGTAGNRKPHKALVGTACSRSQSCEEKVF